MIEAFQALIEPQYRDLKVIMGVMMDDDYVAIPVRVKHPSGTTTTIEDGIQTDCDHAGAQLSVIASDSLVGNFQTGELEINQITHTGIVCDQCAAWKSSPGGEWYE